MTTDAPAPTPTTPLQRQRALFEAALMRPAAMRENFVAHAAADDAALEAAVLRLLAQDAASGDPIAQRLGVAANWSQELTPGAQVGPYTLLSQLGRGGMGTVFKAERADGVYAQAVAIKTLPSGGNIAMREQFQRERELLARLNHPHIAHVLDGGTLANGQAYLVMELVEGWPLDVWLREQRPTLTQRLTLFIALCEAVAHAHQALIVHRDLKPANVMVNASGAPKLLDFGIARLLDKGLGDQTAARIMTRAYASPEQLRGEDALTTSDVYALGLILFELLCGRPLRDEAHSVAGQHGGKKKSAEQQPQQSRASRPSDSKPSRVARGAAALWLRQAAPQLRGDLDHITLMALRENPRERYGTAAAMAADVRRYLAHLPLDTRRGEWRYATLKFIQRHSVAVAAAGLLALASGMFVARLNSARAAALQAEQRARIEASNAQKVALLMRDLFKLADPDTAQGKTMTALDMLEQGEASIRKNRDIEPQVRARLGALIGEIYITIGDSKRSIASLKEAITILRRDPETSDSVLASALHQYGRALESSGQAQLAESPAREAVQLRERIAGPMATQVGESLNSLGVVLQVQARWDEARACYERAEQIFLPQAARFPDELASTQHNLGWLAFQTGRLEDASRMLTAVLAAKRTRLGSAHPRVLNTLLTLSQTRAAMNDLAGAQGLAAELLSAAIKVYGEHSERTLRAYNELAVISHDLGRYQQAGENYARSVPVGTANAPTLEQDKLVAGDSLGAAIYFNNLASLREDQGDFATSETLLRQSLAMRQRLFNPTHPSVARTQHNLARVLLAQALLTPFPVTALAEAQSLAQLSRTSRTQNFAPDHSERRESDVLWVRLHIARGELDSAATLLAKLNASMAVDTLTGTGIVRWYDAQIELARARSDGAKLRTLITEKRARLAKALPVGHPLLAIAALELAEYQLKTGDAGAALALAKPVADTLRRELSPSSDVLRRLKAVLMRQ
jgi:eukaryotic-like serine/threonine-protein kinase